MIIYEKGDVVKAFEEKHQVLVHGCNCQCVMGAGVAKAIRAKYPIVYEQDLRFDSMFESKEDKLSHIDVVRIKDGKYVINAYTQLYYGRVKDMVYVSYNALTLCFRRLYTTCKTLGVSSVCAPFIGAGLAGGELS